LFYDLISVVNMLLKYSLLIMLQLKLKSKMIFRIFLNLIFLAKYSMDTYSAVHSLHVFLHFSLDVQTIMYSTIKQFVGHVYLHVHHIFDPHITGSLIVSSELLFDAIYQFGALLL